MTLKFDKHFCTRLLVGHGVHTLGHSRIVYARVSNCRMKLSATDTGAPASNAQEVQTSQEAHSPLQALASEAKVIL